MSIDFVLGSFELHPKSDMSLSTLIQTQAHTRINACHGSGAVFVIETSYVLGSEKDLVWLELKEVLETKRPCKDKTTAADECALAENYTLEEYEIEENDVVEENCIFVTFCILAECNVSAASSSLRRVEERAAQVEQMLQAAVGPCSSARRSIDEAWS